MNQVISVEKFNLIKQKHGLYGSWAIWAKAGKTPKSNMGDISIFNDLENLALLKPGVVMVGLNLSRFTPLEPFRNFHDPNPRANDFKIRHAFEGTDYYGAYMTDIIKGVVDVDSKNIPNHLKKNPEVLHKSMETFREELRDLGGGKPLLLAFGALAHAVLVENLREDEYWKLIRITHYSHQIGKEQFREKVLEKIIGAL
ncbi:hypothetical protein EBX31_10050 [bacterium]|nr:hypothetical protein [bacterium]